MVITTVTQVKPTFMATSLNLFGTKQHILEWELPLNQNQQDHLSLLGMYPLVTGISMTTKKMFGDQNQVNF